jgi:hypothetical protein
MESLVVRISLRDHRIHIAGTDSLGARINRDVWIVQESV